MSYSEDNISILIATMHRSDFSFLDDMFPHHHWQDLNLVIVNQTKKGNEIKSELENIIVVNSYEVGLSKSRNLAIESCQTQFGLITDDDVIFLEQFFTETSGGINRHPQATLLSFKSVNLEKSPRKRYPSSETNFSLPLGGFVPSSIEIVLNCQLLKSNGLRFNENFGLGAYFPLGEEEVFLNLILSRKQEAWFIPKEIVMHDQISSGSFKSNKSLLKTKVVLYYINRGEWVQLWFFKFMFYIWRKGFVKTCDLWRIYREFQDALIYYKSLK